MKDRYVIAVYGTLKSDKRYALLGDIDLKKGSKLLGKSHIKYAQLYTNKKIKHWPMITDGLNLVECEIYEVTAYTFQELKYGEEMKSYHTRHITTESGVQAFAWFYDTDQVENKWNKVNKY